MRSLITDVLNPHHKRPSACSKVAGHTSGTDVTVSEVTGWVGERASEGRADLAMVGMGLEDCKQWDASGDQWSFRSSMRGWDSLKHTMTAVLLRVK